MATDFFLGRLLLDQGADVEDSGWSMIGKALIVASSNGLEKTVKALLERGANVNDRSMLGGSALHVACLHGHERVVRVLLARGADIDTQDGYGSPLQNACEGGHEGIVQLLLLLLDKFVDLDAQRLCHDEALVTASRIGKKRIVEILLDNGADVDAGTDDVYDVYSRGRHYRTALQEACINGHEEAAILLLNRGADINLQLGYYGNAVQAALASGQEHLAQILLGRGTFIDPNGPGYENALRISLQNSEKTHQILKDIPARGLKRRYLVIE